MKQPGQAWALYIGIMEPKKENAIPEFGFTLLIALIYRLI